jgi:hypothetical protein
MSYANTDRGPESGMVDVVHNMNRRRLNLSHSTDQDAAEDNSPKHSSLFVYSQGASLQDGVLKWNVYQKTI